MKRLALLVALLACPAALWAQDARISGSVSADSPCPGAACVQLLNMVDKEVAAINVSGTWSGELVVEVSVNNLHWFATQVWSPAVANQRSVIQPTAGDPAFYSVYLVGTRSVRVRASSWTSGTAVITINAGAGQTLLGSPTLQTLHDDLANIDSKVTAVNTNSVTVAASALPSGAALSAEQITANNSLSSIDAKIVAVNTGAVTVSGSALPSGAATAAKQPALGTAGAASADVLSVQGRASMTPLLVDGSGVTQPVSVASLPSHAVTNAGTFAVQVTSAPSTAVTGTFWQATQPVSGTVTANAGTNLNTSALALEAGHLAAIDTATARIPPQGQAVAGSSMPVVLPAAQVTTLTPPAAITGFALEAGHLAAIDTSTAKIPAQGQALAAASLPVVLTAAQITTLTPPAAIAGFALDATLTGGTQTTRVTDGTNTAAVKAASSIAVVGDPSLVVQISPNNVNVPTTLQTVAAAAATTLNSGRALLTEQQTQTTSLQLIDNIVSGNGVNITQFGNTNVVTGTGAGGAGIPRVTVSNDSSVLVSSLPALAVGTNVVGGTFLAQTARTSGTLTSTTCPGTGCVSITTTNYGSATVTLTGTYSLSPVFEFSDDGTTFYPLTCTRTDAAVQESAPGALLNLSRAWDCSVYASTSFRVRAATFVSGTGNIGLTLSAASVEAAPTVSLAHAMGYGLADATTVRVVQAQEATYSAGLTIKTATAAGTGPFFTICGSSTKTLRIQKFMVSGTVATAAVWGDVVLKKTSTATSAGTATALTKAPFDSNSAASTANAVNFYTVLATAGTSVGVLATQTQLFPITVISATLQPTPPPMLFSWRDQDSESPVLRGTAQCLEANFGTTTTNAPTLSVFVVWTEK